MFPAKKRIQAMDDQFVRKKPREVVMQLAKGVDVDHFLVLACGKWSLDIAGMREASRG